MFSKHSLNKSDEEKVQSIHPFTVQSIEGKEIRFADFKGKKILVVNVASECGFTPQYQQLQELYDHFKDQMVIIGFPTNNFGGQEPGTDQDIAIFCQKNYGVTFPMAAKIDLPRHPVYGWLTQKQQNGVMDEEVRWNFHKFILDGQGHLVASFPSSVSPLDDVLLTALGIA
ncbi:MAG: glutathione peroxidase [Bacteroidota bacterium]